MNVISLLRFFAACFITNSHFTALYPKSIDFLSTGGPIGNGIFFFCSGFVLYYGKKDNLFEWYLKRLFRLYPAVWIFIFILFIFYDRTYNLVSIILTPYWFLKALIIIYLFYFFTVKYLSKYLIQVMLVSFIPFVLTFNCLSTNRISFIVETSIRTYGLVYYYYYVIMILGAYVAKSKKSKKYDKRDLGKNILFLLLFLFLYNGYKAYVMDWNLWLPQLLVPILLIPLVYQIYQFCNIIVQLYSINNYIQNIVVIISNITLEIYIVQFVIINFCIQFKFPIGFSFSMILILLSAYILNKISQPVNVFFKKNIEIIFFRSLNKKNGDNIGGKDEKTSSKQ